MTAEIITVGTELITGNTVDTHSAWLSRQCFSLGIEVRFHSSVGDDREALLQVLKLASGRSSLVILCGGLGPTMDDLTRETVAEFLGITLMPDREVLERLERLFAGRGVPMPPNNRKQALVFPGGTVFHNERGTAPGLAVTQGGVTYVLLPGPPGELYPMFERSVRPFLLERFSEGKVFLSETLSFFGIGESALEEKLKDLMLPKEGLIVATYAKEAGVSLRITAHGRSEKEARDRMLPVREEVLRRVGKYCYSPDDRSPEEAVVSLLAEAGQTVAGSDSSTGGLLAELISSVPGASRVLKGGFVAYTEDVKENVAGVPAEVISRYGTVSAETAEALARHALERFDADFGISVTGVAGPASAEGKPPGLVFIGFAEKGKPVRCHRLDLKGDRRKIRLLAAKTSCFILQQRLKKGETDA